MPQIQFFSDVVRLINCYIIIIIIMGYTTVMTFLLVISPLPTAMST